MQFGTLQSVIVGVGAAAAVIAITGAASGSGVGAIFNLGKTNKVNATSSLTGSTKHSMLSVTNRGTGPALSLQVRKGKAPFGVNSSGRVANLNASLLGGLAASQFVQGGGTSRSFGFTMSTSADTQQKLLLVPGFGTLKAFCGGGSSGSGEVILQSGTHAMDRFGAGIENLSLVTVGNSVVTPNTPWLEADVNVSEVGGVWEQQILRYATGSGRSLTTHTATLNIMVDVDSTTCDFDASAIIGPAATGP
jgi:hypothetical protein